MKYLISPVLLTLILSSCGNDVEEIKDPSTGTVLKRYEYYTDDNGQKVKDGEYTEWFADGSLKLQENYEDGKKEGECKVYQGKDSIYINIYQNGKRNGICSLESSNGTILATYTYKDNKQNGETVYNYANGKPYCKANYINDIPQGKWTYFDEKGKKTGQLTLDSGIPKELIGIWEVQGLQMTYFTFNDEMITSVWEPYNKYALEPFESMRGHYSFGRYLLMRFGAGAFTKGFDFEIKSIEKDKLVLWNTGTEEEWVMNRVKDI